MKRKKGYLILIVLLMTTIFSATAQTPAGVEAVDLGLPSGTKWANMKVG